MNGLNVDGWRAFIDTPDPGSGARDSSIILCGVCAVWLVCPARARRLCFTRFWTLGHNGHEFSCDAVWKKVTLLERRSGEGWGVGSLQHPSSVAEVTRDKCQDVLGSETNDHSLFPGHNLTNGHSVGKVFKPVSL
ncbi:hypothetical protein BgiBS90_027291 [Biomphalaria glabrata]|nr:hypothetical protein BgiBS90_027291 [Biomphalaria glabrata]